MKPIATILTQLHDDEVELEQQFHVVAERHRTDHEIRHVAVDLARWSLMNRQSLASLAQRFGDELKEDQEPQTKSHSSLREKSAELLGRRPEPALLLLRDLRELYLMASGNSVLWTMLGQAAQSSQDSELLAVVTECHDRTIRQVTWCNAMIKVISQQALVAV